MLDKDICVVVKRKEKKRQIKEFNPITNSNTS